MKVNLDGKQTKQLTEQSNLQKILVGDLARGGLLSHHVEVQLDLQLLPDALPETLTRNTIVHFCIMHESHTQPTISVAGVARFNDYDILNIKINLRSSKIHHSIPLQGLSRRFYIALI